MAGSTKTDPCPRSFNRTQKQREKAKIAAKDYRERAKIKSQRNENTILYRKLLRKFIQLHMTETFHASKAQSFEESDLDMQLFPL